MNMRMGKGRKRSTVSQGPEMQGSVPYILPTQPKPLLSFHTAKLMLSPFAIISAYFALFAWSQSKKTKKLCPVSSIVVSIYHSGKA